MNKQAHIYDWAKKRGFYGRTGEISHLLLDKGVLCVPESANGDFNHEYAKGVVMGGRRPCLVEYKLKIFRMFYDLDILTTRENAKKMTTGVFTEEIKNVFYTICIATAMMFDITKTTVTMCISNIPKKKDDGVKVGVHLTFDNIFVTSPTALHVREKVLETLVCEHNPFDNTWDSIVDVSVFKGSGMRLPWSAKHDDPKRVYIPVVDYILDSENTGVVEEPLDNDEIVKSVSAVRNILNRVCLRSKGVPTKLRNQDIDIDDVSPSYSGSFSHPSLKQYAHVIEELERHIPEVYNGKISGVIRTEHVYMFRHTSKYCANVEREHTSSNAYFMVTKSGMKQCCYSRKEEDVGRKYCLCSQFRGDVIKLPKKLIEELFPEEVDDKSAELLKLPPPTPSSSKDSFLDIDNIVKRSAAVKKSIKKKPVSANKSIRKYHTGSVISEMFGK
ncbi:DNA primase [Paramecium bursaria Chlorella virus CvsA1]|nr:DNA primase [Paramecium bursaria Chlorella virus CviKI]AGE52602.1 DNA primase [Paramecium bursaria Chlorella virus CvsA1]AGE55396.1 DNA primase [Paramecium bursaria Chlorella virus MA1E]